MKVKKTVGFKEDGEFRKSYTIHTECGHEFIAAANGRNAGYRCEGVFYRSVKDIKAAIESGDVFWNDDSGWVPADDADENKSPMWDCIDPCALLIYNMMEHDLVLGHNEMTTLDNHGWLLEDGKVDSDRAKHEYERISS